MKVCLISLGCDKNLVDSEMMLGFLNRGNVSFTDQYDEADAVIVNTCCFILDAKKESVSTILDMAEKKKAGTIKALIITGCMAERYRDEIMKEIPEVDAVVGTSGYDRIEEVLKKAMHGKKVSEFEDLDRLPAVSEKRMLSTLGWYAYLKIAEGCDKHCTYCIIPSLRGNYRSYPEKVLLDQAEQLSKAGVKELILVAQETTVYGKDFDGKKHLPELLRKLCRIDGIEWIRILYCYPEEITEELIGTIRDEKKICHYLDIPIQHASDDILKRMGRRTNCSDLTEIITAIRKEIPDIALRTTLISGFPGETDKDHKKLLSFVRKMKFTRLGVFPYSAEEGTPAAKFPGQIPQRVKKARMNEIMALQKKISASRMHGMIGRKLEVLVEGYMPDDGVYAGRTYMDAPDVDGYIFFKGSREYHSGELVNVLVTDASEYDLKGETV